MHRHTWVFVVLSQRHRNSSRPMCMDQLHNWKDVCPMCTKEEKCMENDSKTLIHLPFDDFTSPLLRYNGLKLCNSSSSRTHEKKNNNQKEWMCWYHYHWSWYIWWQDLYTVWLLWNSLHLHFMKQICVLEFFSRAISLPLSCSLTRNSILHILKYIYFITEMYKKKYIYTAKDAGKMKM